MIKEAIGVGETEVDALNDAKNQLGLDESAEVEFELIQRAEKKKFGLLESGTRRFIPPWKYFYIPASR